jgi:hypothetical protein
MSYRSKMLIQELVESRKMESQRIHNQYIRAMEIRQSNRRRVNKLINTILGDFPEDKQVLPHNVD